MIGRLFEENQAGFTVYLPDCTQSRLWGNLDHAIHQATDFMPIYRQWIYHDYNSVMRFYAAPSEEVADHPDPQEAAHKYDTIPATDLRYGHLVVKLLLCGPSLLTVWRGDNAIETLLKLKGATQPAAAGTETLRGRFWCDNGVCNLLHSSDDLAEAQREIRAVGLSDIFDQEAVALPLIDPIDLPINYVAHSGIVVLCDVVKRLLFTTNTPYQLDVLLPASGDAKETNQVFTTALQDASQHLPQSLSRFITAYLSGDVIEVITMLNQMPVSRWEHFVIQCGVINRDKWLNAKS